jgi:hypothetical protein
MDDLRFLFEFVVTVAALTVPVVVGVRMLAGDQSADMPWPRGVQEEEPKSWNVHVLDRGSVRTRPVGPERRGHRHPLPSSR